MCEQRDSMREVRKAAECLSAVCRARSAPAVRALASFYDQTVEEPVPGAILSTLLGLDGKNPN